MKQVVVVLSLAATVLAGCSSDLSVTSDLGEAVIVKHSAVTVASWGKPEAEEVLGSPLLNFWNDALNECLKTKYLTASNCTNSEKLDEETKDQKALQRFISDDLTIATVSYRPISVDLNGKKTAALKYTKIACIPKSFDDEQSIVAYRAAKVANLTVVESGGAGVDDSVRWKVCQKYGGS